MAMSERFQTIAVAADVARREASAAGGGLDSLAGLAANVPTPALTRLVRAQAQTVDTVVLPGHCPQTTIGRERSTNPYLLQLQASGA